MELHEIEVTIDEKGNVLVHVRGVQGSACTRLTSDLEKAIGEVVSRDMTSEAYDEPQEEHLNQRNQA